MDEYPRVVLAVQPVREMWRRDTVAFCKTRDAVSDGRNDAGTVTERDARIGFGGAVAAFGHHQVTVIQRCRAGLDEHFAAAGCWHVALGSGQGLDPGLIADVIAGIGHVGCLRYFGVRSAGKRLRREGQSRCDDLASCYAVAHAGRYSSTSAAISSVA